VSQQKVGGGGARFADCKSGVLLAVEDEDRATGGGKNPRQQASRESAAEYHGVVMHPKLLAKRLARHLVGLEAIRFQT
jgi:hypothetical protein